MIENCYLLLLCIYIFSVYVIVLSVVYFCCVCREVIVVIFCGVMNEEEVYGGGDGGYIGGVFGFLGGVGVDFYVRVYIIICFYDNRKLKYWLYCKIYDWVNILYYRIIVEFKKRKKNYI